MRQVYVHCNYEWSSIGTRRTRSILDCTRLRAWKQSKCFATIPSSLQYQAHDSEDRILVLGQTNTGRLLAVVYIERGEKIRVVTAYPMSKRLEAIYFQE